MCARRSSPISPASARVLRRATTGEIISRLTADTTQIKSAVGASVSVALRNLVLFVGAGLMMVFTSPRLSGFVPLAIPLIVLPLVFRPRGAPPFARRAGHARRHASAYAAELIGAVRTLQAYTNERLTIARFGEAVEDAFDAAAASIKGARVPHRGRHLPRVLRASSSSCGSARRT